MKRWGLRKRKGGKRSLRRKTFLHFLKLPHAFDLAPLSLPKRPIHLFVRVPGDLLGLELKAPHLSASKTVLFPGKLGWSQFWPPAPAAWLCMWRKRMWQVVSEVHETSLFKFAPRSPARSSLFLWPFFPLASRAVCSSSEEHAILRLTWLNTACS